MSRRFEELWPAVVDAIAWDGSWRDIYILETTRSEWNAVMLWLQSGPYLLRLSTAGTVREAPFPDIEQLIVADERDLSTLNVELSGISLNCHFFELESIEFDIDPRDVNVGTWPDLANFLLGLSAAAGKVCILTEENAREQIIAVADAGNDWVLIDRTYPGAHENRWNS